MKISEQNLHKIKWPAFLESWPLSLKKQSAL